MSKGAMRVTIQTKGLREIREALNMLPREVAGEPLREVALIGAEVIRQQAVANAEKRRRTGNLAKNIEKEIARESIGTRVVVHIGPNKDAWYGRLVEFGHAIVRVTNRIRNAAGRTVRRETVNLGQVPPHPWLRPAFDAKRREAQQVMEQEFRRRLERIWRRAR